MSNELPQGWIETPLETLAADTHYPIGDGDHGQIKPATYTDSGIPYIRVGDMGWGKFDPKGLVHIPKSVHEQNLKSELLPGDILIAKTGATIGKCCIIPDSIPKANTTSSVGKVTINRDVTSPEWILYNFLSRRFNDQMWAVSHKTAQPGFNIRDLKLFSIPLAPRAEQRRIVAKLETLLGKVVASQQRLAKISVLLKRFRQSVLAAACSGRLTADWREENPDTELASALLERIASQFGQTLITCDVNELPFDIPSSWESIQASDLCRPRKIITYGVLKPIWVKDGVPTVRVQDMKQGQILVDQVAQCCPERAKKFSKTTLEAGDLLIAKDGATLGKTAFVPPELAGGNITQHVLRFPISHLVESVFVRLIIDSRHGQEWMRSETRGAALPGVNVGDFRRMPIPLPPLPEQQEIVRRVEGLFALADQLEVRLAKARGQVDQLTPSLLARAFAGKLVPQDPTDEPAEKLLERIDKTQTDNSRKNNASKKSQVGASRHRQPKSG